MTGAIIGAVGTVLAAIFTILVGYFVKRTDSVAKATRANMRDQQYVMQLIGTVRDDYWTLSGVEYQVRELANRWRARLQAHGEAVESLPERPVPKHLRLEERHVMGQDTTEAEG